jgi:hypothetical protein
MKWEEVRKIYPNTFVKIRILGSHVKDNIRYIDEMEVIETYENDIEATRELVRAKDDIFIYHTSNEVIEVKIKQLFGYRGVINETRI